MNLPPTELERLTIFSAAEPARRYRARGLRLSYPETVALITDEVMVRNDALPRIDVDAQTHDVFVDGAKVQIAAVTRVPLCRKFLLR